MSDIFKTFPNSPFELHAPYEPSGDQPQAIEELNEGLESGLAFQTLGRDRFGQNLYDGQCHRQTRCARAHHGAQ